MNQLQLAQATENMQAANLVFSKHFPQSVEYATSLLDLSTVSFPFNQAQAEGYMQQAREIYSAYFPTCFYYGICLASLGTIEALKGKREEAVRLLAEARQIYVESGSRERQAEIDQAMIVLGS